MRMILQSNYEHGAELSMLSPKLATLNAVEMVSYVYSREQARAEFERFLNAIDLKETANA